MAPPIAQPAAAATGESQRTETSEMRMADERDGNARLTLAAMRAVLCLIGCAVACDRGRAPDPPPAAPGEVAPARSSCALSPLALRRPGAPRVVAIGDLHGDVDAARDALRIAGAIDDRAHWIGGELVVVQTG